MVAKEEGLRQVAAEKAVWGDEGQDDQAVRSQDEKCLYTWRGCASLFSSWLWVREHGRREPARGRVHM